MKKKKLKREGSELKIVSFPSTDDLVRNKEIKISWGDKILFPDMVGGLDPRFELNQRINLGQRRTGARNFPQ